jgi:hypothetical protein
LSNEWFEIPVLQRFDGVHPQKLRFCADASVPGPLIRTLRLHKIPIRTAIEAGINRNSDEDIWAWAKRQKKILITFDEDFWSDREFPLLECPGLIFIDLPPRRVAQAVDAFDLVYITFQNIGLPTWYGRKIKASIDGYLMKQVSTKGNRTFYQVKIHNGRLYAKELIQSGQKA